jgi:hypothetical protein
MIRLLVLAGVAWILIAACGWWVLAAVVVATALWAINRCGTAAGDRTHAQNVAEAQLVRRADEQQQAMLRGDLRKGIYGEYPPAI